jgi:hypothetical protein
MILAALIGLTSAWAIGNRLGPGSSLPTSGIEVLGITDTRPQPQRSLSGAQPGQATPTAAPAPQAAPPLPSATPATNRLTIVKTDGQGVVLRNSPRMDDRTPRGVFEGSQVTVVERSGADWVKVRSAQGEEGWIPTQYTAPAR